MTRSLEHWRGVTLKMGLLYEHAAVEFWDGVVRSVSATDAAAAHARAEDDGAMIASPRAGGVDTLDA